MAAFAGPAMADVDFDDSRNKKFEERLDERAGRPRRGLLRRARGRLRGRVLLLQPLRRLRHRRRLGSRLGRSSSQRIGAGANSSSGPAASPSWPGGERSGAKNHVAYRPPQEGLDEGDSGHEQPSQLGGVEESS